MSLFNELKPRNVIRVAVAYLIIAWLIAQVSDLVLETISAPIWVMQTLLFILALGFIVSGIVSWAYELTKDGIKKESEVDRSRSITHHTAKKLDIITIIALITIGSLVLWQQFSTNVGDSRLRGNDEGIEVNQPSGTFINQLSPNFC